MRFLEDYLVQVKSRLNTKNEKENYRVIEHDLREGFYIESLFYGAQLSSYNDMKMYYHYLDSHGYFQGKLDKIHFFWSWFRAYKTRK